MKKTNPKTSAFCLLPSAFPRGFTLIELMVVMVVIAILGGITISVSKYVSLRARRAQQQIYIEKIKSALEDYRAAYGEYPITGKPNVLTGQIENPDDVERHYPASFATYCAAITQGVYSVAGYGNSPYTNVGLKTNTVEDISGRKIDYCLTYPLMLRQRAAGARSFMEFKDVTVAYVVYHPKQEENVDRWKITKLFKSALGDVIPKSEEYLRGNAVNRAKAIDPVSQKQWKYTSEDGMTYILATNTF